MSELIILAMFVVAFIALYAAVSVGYRVLYRRCRWFRRRMNRFFRSLPMWR